MNRVGTTKTYPSQVHSIETFMAVIFIICRLLVNKLSTFQTKEIQNGLREIQGTLLWASDNLRVPRINSLEGWGVESKPPDSPNNRRWMQVFTTMGLTHSNGYVQMNSQGLGHRHWYKFWDADLGTPLSGKAEIHAGIEGLFIREFTKGWAVYNRSGNVQPITLPIEGTPVSARSSSGASLTHQLPDLDGEIYLKVKNPADVNQDGLVNVLDLLAVANGFGTSAPDLNGDGVVDVRDLALVAGMF